jgi:hypothetical protein
MVENSKVQAVMRSASGTIVLQLNQGFGFLHAGSLLAVYGVTGLGAFSFHFNLISLNTNPSTAFVK